VGGNVASDAELVADNLGDTPQEKALIKEIYAATKAAYEKEAVKR
jgi:hypothetical protein